MKTLFPLIALLVLPILLSPASAASASPTQITEILPEPYPFSDRYPVEIVLPDSSLLISLNAMRLDVGNVESLLDGTLLVTAYVDPAQDSTLTQLGLQVTNIPNQGYRSFLAYGPGSSSPDAWPTFDQYVARMQAIETAYPAIVDMTIIGTSFNGYNLYCLQITDNPGVDEYEPEFKYTAAHHGDETTGIEMTVRLAELLASNYDIDPDLTTLVNEMEIWLCPIYNPDGYIAGSRYNGNGQDLNRDFPDRFTDPVDDPAGREPETQAFMYWGYDHRFVMGANYHGGAQVLNYPWDAVSGQPYYAPDDSLFFDFGYGYTFRNSDLFYNPEFQPYGITRGWEWYMIYGGMQDWAYLYRGEHHVTLEISNTKSPAFTLMDGYWDRNRDAMLWWMSQSLTGMRGLVLDARNSAPLNAIITVNGMGQPNFARTDPPVGDYHRVISPGDYTLTASADGYYPLSASVTVISGTVVTQDFYLQPIADLTGSTKTVSGSSALPGEQVLYQVSVINFGSSVTATLTDTLPAGLDWSGYLTATLGTPAYADGQIFWQGPADPAQPVTITYGVVLTECLPAGFELLNLAEFSDGVSVISRTATLSVENALPSYPSGPVPVDGALNQPLGSTLSWDASSDLNCDLITYDIYFGTDTNPPLVASTLDPSYDPGPLLPGQQYYWFIAPRDNLGGVPGPLWTFTTNLFWQLFLPLVIH